MFHLQKEPRVSRAQRAQCVKNKLIATSVFIGFIIKVAKDLPNYFYNDFFLLGLFPVVNKYFYIIFSVLKRPGGEKSEMESFKKWVFPCFCLRYLHTCSLSPETKAKRES